MSNFQRQVINPKTGKKELATWIDNYFDKREYGVMFSDGKVYREDELEKRL